MTCEIKGCRTSHYGRGWCQKHYMNWYRTGNPIPSRLSKTYLKRQPTASLKKRLKDNSVRTDNGCLLWQGALIQTGHGRIWYQGRLSVTHRLSYEMYIGSIPEGYDVHHVCREPACIESTHLEIIEHAKHVSMHRKNDR